MIEVTPDNSASDVFFIDHGVYGKKLKIVTVKDLSNYPTHPEWEPKQVGSKNKEPDQCLEIEFIDGDYQKKRKLWRSWQKDKDTKQPIGWATWRNPVLMFFIAAIGEEKLEFNDDWTIPQQMLIDACAEDVIAIQYQTNRWWDSKDVNNPWSGYIRDYYPFMFNMSVDKERIKEFWLAGLSYTKDYARDIAIAKEKERAENKQTNQISESEDFNKDNTEKTKVEDDDDLPF